MENYDEIRTTLEARHERLAELLGRVEISARRQFDKSLEEQAIQRENEQVLTHLDESLNREFFEVQQALARIDSGEYGTCENCGEEIARKRLEAIPHASLCIRCAA